MSNYTITLPEETYKTLLEIAKEQGLTPENWIASQIFKKQSEEKLLSEQIGDLIGAIDSQTEPYHQFKKTEFGEQIATKLSKQGLQRP
ncbi:hypothetical protein [Planktothrix sp.]|uniref:hypothetical protein n=2 Tax=Planktothrix sp. TaxID=3088171 RepID=UPI0038D387AF